MTGDGALPLSRFEVIATRDIDDARIAVSRAYREHRMDVLGPPNPFFAHVCVAPLRRLQLSFISYGATTSVEAGELGFYLIHAPISGSAEYTDGGQQTVVDGGCGRVSSATWPVRLRFSPDCSHIAARVEQSDLDRHLEALTGVTPSRPIVFAPRMPTRSGAGAFIRRLVLLLASELERGDHLLSAPLALTALEDTLLTALLTGQPHNYSARFQNVSPEPAPRAVRWVEEYIEAHAHEAVTIGDLTRIAGCSARSLYRAFRRHRGYAPMAFLRRVRLDRARSAFLAAGDDATVTQIALDFGFNHFGRFSGEYRRRFGETPSQTLRNR